MSEEKFHIKIPQTFFPPMTLDEIQEKNTQLKKAGLINWSMEPVAEAPVKIDLVEEFNDQDKELYETYHKERIAAKREYENAKRPLTQKYESRLNASWETYVNSRDRLLEQMKKKLAEERKEDPQQELS